RHLASDGKIEFCYWWDPKIIENVDCLHVSELEAEYLGFGKDLTIVVNKLLETPLTSVILTRGRNGAILGFKNKKNHHIFNVPAYLEGNTIDETGAGDIFLFAYVNHLLRFHDELDAVAFATSITSLFLEQKRPLTSFSTETVRLRQEKVRSEIIEFSKS
ncbi:MAG: PfkB family carbohydrate kinase, partial [Promethearchaeota archaeon]